MSKALKVYECSIVGCSRKTTLKRHKNPRLRWMINLCLKNHRDDCQSQSICDCPDRVLNLCPEHVRTSFNLTEDFYTRTENAEKYISVPSEAVQ